MIDYEKIERIAAALESRLGITAGENEKGVDMNEIMPPAAEASEEEKFSRECAEFENQLDKMDEGADEACKCTGQPDCTCPECVKEQTASRMASLKRLIKLARSVKANTNLTASQKKEALDKIRMAADSMNKGTLNKAISTTGITKANTRAKLQEFFERLDDTKKNMTLSQIVDEFGINTSTVLNQQLGKYTAKQLFTFLFSFVEKIEKAMDKKEQEQKAAKNDADDDQTEK